MTNHDVRARATYEDILALPEGVRGEIVFGMLETQAQPRPLHQSVASELIASLLPPFRHGQGGPGGWWIISAPEIHAGGHVLVPDLAAWRVARMPALPDAACFSLAPDWVCEILSSSTATRDRGAKMEAYAEIGVEHVWLVDADARRIDVFHRGATQWTRRGELTGGTRGRAEPFDAIELDFGALFETAVVL